MQVDQSEEDARLAAPLGLQEIQALAQLLRDYGLSELELSRPSGEQLRLRREAGGAEPRKAAVLPGPAAPAAPAAAAAAPRPVGITVTSPFVGTFYRAPNPDSPPFIEVGQRVRKGQTLCLIEAMKLMNELESEWEGVVAECLVENGRPVEYGQALFRIDPKG